MKLRILSLFSIYFLTNNYIFSQWVQTEGTHGSTNVSAFIIHDQLQIIATNY
jgi:hypothetical protein